MQDDPKMTTGRIRSPFGRRCWVLFSPNITRTQRGKKADPVCATKVISLGVNEKVSGTTSSRVVKLVIFAAATAPHTNRKAKPSSIHHRHNRRSKSPVVYLLVSNLIVYFQTKKINKANHDIHGMVE